MPDVLAFLPRRMTDTGTGSPNKSRRCCLALPSPPRFFPECYTVAGYESSRRSWDVLFLHMPAELQRSADLLYLYAASLLRPKLVESA